jgi:hypothetical protein
MDAEGDAEEDGGEEGEGDHWEMLRRCNEPTTSALFCLGGSFLRKIPLGKSSGGWWPTSSDILHDLFQFAHDKIHNNNLL